MPSRREIARDWHVAKSWIDRCVAELGCPGSSLEEARKWREENSRRSVATYQRSIARQIEEEEDSNSPEARIQKAKAYTEYGTSMRCSECQPLKISRTSPGTMSPAESFTTSPGTRSRSGISLALPSRTTVAVTVIIALSLAAALSARVSCTKRSDMPSTTINIMIVPAAKSPVE